MYRNDFELASLAFVQSISNSSRLPKSCLNAGFRWGLAVEYQMRVLRLIQKECGDSPDTRLRCREVRNWGFGVSASGQSQLKPVCIRALRKSSACFLQINHHFGLIEWEDSAFHCSRCLIHLSDREGQWANETLPSKNIVIYLLLNNTT